MKNNENTLLVAKELKRAALALAQVCDGAVEDDGMGYNSADTGFGRHIALVPAEEWTPQICFAVYETLRKYKNQLYNYDIDYDDLPKPQVEYETKVARNKLKTLAEKKEKQQKREEALKNFKKTGVAVEALKADYLAYEKNGVVYLKSPKNMDFISSFKEKVHYKCRHWDGFERVWNFFPADAMANSLEGLLQVLSDFNFVCQDGMIDKLKDRLSALKKKEEKEKKQPNIWIEGSLIVARTPYDSAAVAAMKDVSGRRWDSTKKVNTFPLNAISGDAVIGMANKFGWSIESSARSTLDSLGEKAVEMVNSSSTVDASIGEIEGLGSEDLRLRPFQRGGVAYALKAKRTFLADEMGLGKTIQALATLQAIGAFPALIVVPKSVKLQWVSEASKWLPGRSVSVLNGGKDRNYKSDILVINYDILTKHEKNLKTLNLKAVVLDEGHMIKNPKARRSVAAIALGEGVEHRLILTGTSVLNRPVELVNQLKFLGRLEELGGFWGFVNEFCDAKREEYGWDFKGKSNLDKLAKMLRSCCYVRREKKEVAKELPPIQRSVVQMELDKPGAYDKAVWNISQELKQKKHEGDMQAYRAFALSRIEKLKQLAVEHKMNNMLDWIKTFLDSSEEKLVVFAHHKDAQEKLFEELKEYNPARIRGGDSDKAREDAVKRFWDDDLCRVMVASIQATNFGINLQVASNVAFCEFGWHAAIMDQAEARVHRIGSKANNINSYWLAAEGTIDGDIINLIESKREITEAINSGQEIPKDVDLVSWFEGLMETGKKDK